MIRMKVAIAKIGEPTSGQEMTGSESFYGIVGTYC